MNETDERALESVVKQFRGGEHALAGKRAAQLVYGKSEKPNTAFLGKLTEAAPGIERYISPDGITPPTPDQGGNPLATQPENDPEQNNASNVSSDEAKAEQDAIDDTLSKGRDKVEERADDADDEVGETRLNPEADAPTGTQPASKPGGGRRKPA